METYTYCGLLDDFSLRHGDTAIQSLHELNEYLIASVLFGGRLLINDGHVILNNALQEAVLTSVESPLSNLIEKGYVKILTRNGGDLEKLADEMVQRQITSAQKLTNKPWYKTDYRPALQKWTARLHSPAFDGFMPWPNLDRDDIFKSVATSAFNSLHTAEPQHQKALDIFWKRLSDTPGRRTDWEDETRKLEKEGRLFLDTRLLLMLAASEAYHYSWGCTLGAVGYRPRVLARAPKYLHHLDLLLGEVPEKKTAPVKMFVPDLTFAGKAIKKRWDLLAEMVSAGHEVNQRKEEFLACVAQYYTSMTISDKEVQEKANTYATALSRHFGNTEVVPVMFDLGFLGASTAAGAAAGGPAGVVIGLGIGLVGVAAAHRGGPQAFWKLAAPKTKGWIARLEGSELQHATSSFELSQSQISNYTSTVRHFK